MRGLISVNFIDNGNIRNEYPIVIYYDGQENNIVSSIIDESELSQYIYRNFITPHSYAKTNIYAVTYFSDDNSETEETVTKRMWRIEDLHMLSDRQDLCNKLLNDILIEITNERGNCETLIKELLQNNLSTTTIINYVRYKAQTYNMMKENIKILVNTAQEIINNI